MHGTVMRWVRKLKVEHPNHFSEGCRVLEYGSLDINGGVRSIFNAPQEYVGIDCQAGRGVDWVGVCHEYEHPVGEFDVVISTEMLEHDPYWRKSLEHACSMLRSGGLFIMTCAAPRRAPHNHDDSPEPGYYENRTDDDVLDELAKHAQWENLAAFYNRSDLDLHCVGVKQ